MLSRLYTDGQRCHGSDQGDGVEMGKKSNRTASPSAVYCRVQGPGYGPAGAAAFLTLIFLTLIFLTLIFNSRCPHQGAANIMYTCS